MSGEDVAVYGSGGSAREVAWLGQQCGHRIVCFIDDDPSKTGRSVNDIAVCSLEEAGTRFPAMRIVAGIGDAAARERVMHRATQHGLQPIALIHPAVERSEWITIGAGVVICAGSIVTTNVTIGDHVQVNVACTISHDVEIADFATLAPGVHLSGCVTVGRRAYLGAGATVINGTPNQRIVIGDDAIVGAGACVIRSVNPGITVVGVPARPIDEQRVR